MPFKGNKPIMAPILIIACVLIQANTPITNNREKGSLVRSIIRLNRENNNKYRPKIIDTPIKPNFSARMANIESLAASGR